MSFEDQLRNTMNRIDYSDRDRLLRETARKSVQEFKELCLLKARMCEHFCSLMAKTTEPGKSHLVYIYRDEDYEAAKAMGSPLASLGEHIFLKRSESVFGIHPGSISCSGHAKRPRQHGRRHQQDAEARTVRKGDVGFRIQPSVQGHAVHELVGKRERREITWVLSLNMKWSAQEQSRENYSGCGVENGDIFR